MDLKFLSGGTGGGKNKGVNNIILLVVIIAVFLALRKNSGSFNLAGFLGGGAPQGDDGSPRNRDGDDSYDAEQPKKSRRKKSRRHTYYY